MNKVIELCAGSLEDVVIANQYPIHRIELNAALQLGGLTPSLGLLEAVLQVSNLPIVVMLRPRAGGFHYNEYEIQTMLQDLEILLRYPIEAVAFGVLNKDKTMNESLMRQMIQQCHQKGKKAVFHRAIDVMDAPLEQVIQQCIEIGFDRILTSGRKNKAIDAFEQLETFTKKYQHQITIVVASKIQPSHIQQFQFIQEFHGSFSKQVQDETAQGEEVSFSFAQSVVDPTILEQLPD